MQTSRKSLTVVGSKHMAPTPYRTFVENIPLPHTVFKKHVVFDRLGPTQSALQPKTWQT